MSFLLNARYPTGLWEKFHQKLTRPAFYLLASLVLICGFLWLQSGCSMLGLSSNETPVQQAENLYTRALDALKNNQPYEALNLLDQAIDLNPTYTEAYYCRGNIYFDMNNKDANVRAIEDYSKVIRLSPMNQNAYFNRALAYSRLRSCKQALKDYLRVIEINPNDREAHKNIGILYDDYFAHKEKEAIKYYQKYLQIGGTDQRVKEWIKKLEAKSPGKSKP